MDANSRREPFLGNVCQRAQALNDPKAANAEKRREHYFSNKILTPSPGRFWSNRRQLFPNLMVEESVIRPEPKPAPPGGERYGLLPTVALFRRHSPILKSNTNVLRWSERTLFRGR